MDLYMSLSPAYLLLKVQRNMAAASVLFLREKPANFLIG
jgi:hypothetical protein